MYNGPVQLALWRILVTALFAVHVVLIEMGQVMSKIQLQTQEERFGVNRVSL